MQLCSKLRNMIQENISCVKHAHHLKTIMLAAQQNVSCSPTSKIGCRKTCEIPSVSDCLTAPAVCCTSCWHAHPLGHTLTVALLERAPLCSCQCLAQLAGTLQSLPLPLSQKLPLRALRLSRPVIVALRSFQLATFIIMHLGD